MTALLAGTSAALILTGVLLGVVGLRRTPAPPPRPPGRRGRVSRLSRLSRRTRVLLGAGLAAGAVIAVVSGWYAALVVVPAAAAGLPALLTAPQGEREIARLEAMEEWTRSLAGVLTVGYGLEQALIATARSAPEPIRPEVTTLVARLRARWSTSDAIRAFADDLDDATGDLIAANLLLAARRRGTGLATVLEALAESVAADVRARRQVEADRAKPRATARWVTLITAAVLVLLALNGSYVAPYGSPFGQVVLLVLLGAYAGVLLWMKSMTRGAKPARFVGVSVATRSAS